MNIRIYSYEMLVYNIDWRISKKSLFFLFLLAKFWLWIDNLIFLMSDRALKFSNQPSLAESVEEPYVILSFDTLSSGVVVSFFDTNVCVGSFYWKKTDFIYIEHLPKLIFTFWNYFLKFLGILVAASLCTPAASPDSFIFLMPDWALKVFNQPLLPETEKFFFVLFFQWRFRLKFLYYLNQ